MTFGNTVYIAVELSVSSWLVAARLAGVERQRQQRLEGGDTVALLALIAELRSLASSKLGGAAEVACCFEAGRDGFWLHRLLTAQALLLTCSSPPASWSTAAHAGPRRTGLTRRECCACWPPGWAAIGTCAAWCAYPRPRRRTPNARTASANISSKRSCGSRTGSRRCCSRRASGEGRRYAHW